MVTTPSGAPVAMVHCNNCTSDTSAWARMIIQILNLYGFDVDKDTIYTKMFQTALEGDPEAQVPSDKALKRYCIFK